MNTTTSKTEGADILKFLALLALTIIVHALIAVPFSVFSGLLKCLY